MSQSKYKIIRILFLLADEILMIGTDLIIMDIGHINLIIMVPYFLISHILIDTLSKQGLNFKKRTPIKLHIIQGILPG